MSSTETTEGEQSMSRRIMSRAGFRPINSETFSEYTGRVGSVYVTGCTILSQCQPEPGAEIELRLYLPGGAWPIRVDRAKVTWGHWDSFTVEFISLPIADQLQLEDYLLNAAPPVAV
jgi:hypothetical protein